MKLINKSECTLDGKKLITEASTIGLAPREWPDFIGVTDTRGVGFLFGPNKRPIANAPDGIHAGPQYGDLIGMVYYDRAGILELHVLND